ncbi:unnamed protein product [Dibothriocephalus latus]|uniref:Uncharacterized protein n=1 Tax=Dibothriocephalus latus TaxID=60516 RepID=A0A3P7PU31_DIBLA|nr:unnamed protein product [Dibothriocephalus latus]
MCGGGGCGCGGCGCGYSGGGCGVVVAVVADSTTMPMTSDPDGMVAATRAELHRVADVPVVDKVVAAALMAAAAGKSIEAGRHK